MTDGRQYQAMARKQISYRISDDRKDFLVRHPEQSTMADCLALIGEIDDTEAECERLRAEKDAAHDKGKAEGIRAGWNAGYAQGHNDANKDRGHAQIYTLSDEDILQAAESMKREALATPPESEPDGETAIEASGWEHEKLPTEQELCDSLSKYAPHTPEHGDALAALEALKSWADSRAEQSGDPALAHSNIGMWARTIRQALTTSSVPYVPESIRALPAEWRACVDQHGAYLSEVAANQRGVYRKCAEELERAIASAPTDGRE